MNTLKKIFLLHLFFYASTACAFQGVDTVIQGTLIESDKSSIQQLSFEEECILSKCEIQTNLHGVFSSAKGFVVFLSAEQQKVFGKKMIVIGSGHQFIGWSKEAQAQSNGTITLKFLDLKKCVESSHQTLFSVEGIYIDHEVNRKAGDYSILAFEPTDDMSASIKPVRLASRDIELSRDTKCYGSGVPLKIGPDEKTELYSIFRYDFRYNFEHGSYDRSMPNAKVIVASLEVDKGCSGGALFAASVDGHPVVLGNCIHRLSGGNKNPADYQLGTGLSGSKAEREVANGKLVRGVYSMYNHVDVLHDALNRACQKESNLKSTEVFSSELLEINKNASKDEFTLWYLNLLSRLYVKALEGAIEP